MDMKILTGYNTTGISRKENINWGNTTSILSDRNNKFKIWS